MKVFVDGLIFAKQKWGGVSRIWREYLPRLSDQGIDVELLVPFFSRNFSLAEITGSRREIEVRRDFFYRPSRYFDRVKMRDRLIRTFYLDNRVDIFHSTYYSTVYTKKSRKVVTVYDMILERMQDEFPARWTRWGMEIKREVVENADAVIAISENTKSDILHLYKNMDEKKISVVHPGFALPAGGSKRSFDSVAGKFSLSAGSGEYLLHVGNRDGYKNFRVIVSLMEKKLVPPGLSFICVGGEDRTALLRQVKDRGLNRDLEFIDYAEDEELAALYRNAKALVFPSKYEGFGMPVLEAMANECPVICSRTSSFPEVAGDAGIFFDPESAESLGEALRYLIQADRQAIVARGLHQSKRFCWDDSVRKIVEVYAALT